MFNKSGYLLFNTKINYFSIPLKKKQIMKFGFSIIFFLIYGILNMIPVQASRDLQT